MPPIAFLRERRANMALSKDIAGAHALTEREQQITALVCGGHSNKVIARELNLREGTVKQHLYVIFRKLAVRNRGELIIASSERREST